MASRKPPQQQQQQHNTVATASPAAAAAAGELHATLATFNRCAKPKTQEKAMEQKRVAGVVDRSKAMKKGKKKRVGNVFISEQACKQQ